VIGGEHFELDALHWTRLDWQLPETADFQAGVRAAIEGVPRWACSGNYLSQAQAIAWPAADTLIWLDIPLRTVLRRVVSRSWRRWREDKLLWGTNREVFWRHLKLWDQEESLISFAVRQHRRKQREYAAELADPRWAQLRKFRLRSARAVAGFLGEDEGEVVRG
jgi:hypothetical protein